MARQAACRSASTHATSARLLPPSSPSCSKALNTVRRRRIARPRSTRLRAAARSPYRSALEPVGGQPAMELPSEWTLTAKEGVAIGFRYLTDSGKALAFGWIWEGKELGVKEVYARMKQLEFRSDADAPALPTLSGHPTTDPHMTLDCLEAQRKRILGSSGLKKIEQQTVIGQHGIALNTFKRHVGWVCNWGSCSSRLCL